MQSNQVADKKTRYIITTYNSQWKSFIIFSSYILRHEKVDAGLTLLSVTWAVTG